VCETNAGICLPICTSGGGECDQFGGYCVPADATGQSHLCLPSCFPANATNAPPGFPSCASPLMCDQYSGVCSNMQPTGAENGAACVMDSDCKGGRCIAEIDDMGQPSGWVGGYCLSFGRADNIRQGAAVPTSNCPPGSGAVPLGGEGAGDSAPCFKTCMANTDCRGGYQCDHLTPSMGTGNFFTNGICLPVDCNDAGMTCPSGYRCVTQPSDAAMPPGQCEALTDGGLPDVVDAAPIDAVSTDVVSTDVVATDVRADVVPTTCSVNGLYSVAAFGTTFNLRIRSDGTYAIYSVLASEADPESRGTYTISGNTLTFTDTGGPRACASTDLLVWSATFNADCSVMMSAVTSDPCPPRNALFTNQTWTRVCTIEGLYSVAAFGTTFNMRIRADGTYAIYSVLASEAMPETAGTYTRSGSTLTFTDTSGDRACPSTQQLVWTAAFNGSCGIMTSTVVSDACPPRNALFTNQMWTRGPDTAPATDGGTGTDAATGG
jgi:hypothetical protein